MSIHRRLKGILKIAVALLLLAWVFYQVEPQRIAGYLQNLSGWHVIASLVFAMLAHSAGAMRLRWFVQAAGAPIAPGFALRLNFIGVFFSFVLPIGGFGGDIVKLAALRNKIGLGMARGVQILVADRLSGLLLFCLMSLGLLAWVDIAVLLPFAGAWLVAGVLLAVCCYFFLSLRFLGQNLRTCLGGIV